MTQAWTFLAQGGWAMAALGVASVAALTLILERAWALRRARVIAPRLVRALEGVERGKDIGALPALCAHTRGAFARLMEEILRMGALSHDQAIERMRAIGRTQVGRLERGLTVLEIIAGVSPLIGLLGTVLGMVDVFNAISAQGMGDPQVLSDGIAKALITTVAGLCVAIPALAFHSLFSKRVDDLAAEIQDRATGFLIILHAHPETKEEARPSE